MAKDGYDKIESITKALAAIAIPVSLAWAGHTVQQQVAQDTLKKEYVQMAITILKEEPTSDQTDMREWAVKLLDDMAPVPMSDKTKARLLTKPIDLRIIPFIGAVGG